MKPEKRQREIDVLTHSLRAIQEVHTATLLAIGKATAEYLHRLDQLEKEVAPSLQLGPLGCAPPPDNA